MTLLRQPLTRLRKLSGGPSGLILAEKSNSSPGGQSGPLGEDVDVAAMSGIHDTLLLKKNPGLESRSGDAVFQLTRTTACVVTDVVIVKPF